MLANTPTTKLQSQDRMLTFKLKQTKNNSSFLYVMRTNVGALILKKAQTFPGKQQLINSDVALYVRDQMTSLVFLEMDVRVL